MFDTNCCFALKFIMRFCGRIYINIRNCNRHFISEVSMQCMLRAVDKLTTELLALACHWRRFQNERRQTRRIQHLRAFRWTSAFPSWLQTHAHSYYTNRPFWVRWNSIVACFLRSLFLKTSGWWRQHSFHTTVLKLKHLNRSNELNRWTD